MTGVSDEELLDRLERGEDAGDLAGAERAAWEEARAGLALAREADCPDPGDAFWAEFERDVRHRLGRRTPRAAVWLAAAAVLTALLVLPPARVAPPAEAWSPLPPAERDAGWKVLSGLGEETAALAPLSECAVEECLLELSEREESALVGLLRAELAGRES